MPKLLHLCAQEGPLSLPYHSQNVEETRAADALSDTSLRSGLWDSMGGSCVKRGLLGPSGLEGLPTLGWDERRENVEIGEDSKMSVVTRVLAYLEHNDKCRTAELDKIPAIPLHEHVVEVALRQLGNGAGINVIQSTNIDMLTHLAYRGQSPANALATINHRYNILPSDFSRLYRQHYRKAFSIDVKIAAEHNVDNWLNPDSTHFKPDLHKSVFQYSARASEGERLKISISTPEMKDAAWAFCHKKQLVLDGTFGLCTSRLLVWIALGVDESGHGLPVAMFLFSAPSGNRATHAGYDTNILAELLSGWKSWLGERHGERFTPYAAITDTDFKERGALLRVWSDLILLLCKFHIRQCWTNKRKSSLPRSESHWRIYANSRLLTLEEALLATTCHADGLHLINRAREDFSFLGLDRDGKQYLDGVAKYLDYLLTTWMPRELWSSWSLHGRKKAADRLGIPVQGVLPTTNHLESLNGNLKRKYVPQWQHSGHRLRFDMLLYRLVSNILPQIYAQHCMVTQYNTWQHKRFGHSVITATSSNSRLHTSSGAPCPRLAWYPADERRDADARAIFANLYLPRLASTGGACKHMRAFRMLVEQWMEGGHILRGSFSFPASLSDAKEIEVKNRAWYGESYAKAVTSPPLEESLPRSQTSSIAAVQGNSHLLDCSESTGLPRHLESAWFSHSDTDKDSLLPPPSHPRSTVLLEADADEASEILRTTGELLALDDEVQISDQPDTAGTEVESVNNRRALQLQLDQKFKHDTARILPALHGITVMLEDPHFSLNMDGSYDEFHNVIQQIALKMRNPRDTMQPNPSLAATTTNSVASTGSSIPPLTARGVIYRDILPPSPEKRQKHMTPMAPSRCSVSSSA
ncbi:hypothetical protein BC835DRAFT_1414886 [Cytidiella melzeri]|nr:hypothetical protein BC835DRAFT_1414886 [Cytidiella melzeri]